MADSSRVRSTRSFFSKTWQRFLALARWAQILIIALILIVLGGIVVLARGNTKSAAATTEPTVTLQTVDSFGANSNGVDALGKVQSVSEADILAQSAGTVTAVHTTIGASVPAGFVIADLDSSSASAAVLQAQGGYDAAVAASKATTLQAQNTTGSFSDEQTDVRNTYISTYTTLQGVLATEVDTVFGDNTPVGPALLINPLTTNDTFPRQRYAIKQLMDTWQASLSTVQTTDPLTLLSTAQSNLAMVSSFLTGLTDLANTQESAATPAQLAALAAAQTSVNMLIATVSSARTTYDTAATASAVGQTQTSNSSGDGVTSAQASIEEALGALRSAQAAYEKTIVRAPIAGTVNFLPIHVGDYVTSNEHVATVAQNNTLEVVMELSQDDANRLAVGDTVTMDNTYKGIVTTIAPALDPTTEEIEVHVAVDAGSDLVNGQSVQVALPALPTDAATGGAFAASSTSASSTPSIEIPLTAVKLLPNERDVFTVDSTGHIVAHQVTIGDVVGDLIQITSPLDPSLEIITDVRGLSAGDAVHVSP